MIRVALIGLGKMGISHLAIVRSHPSVELVAVCDTTAYVLDILSKYTGLKTYTDYKALLFHEKLDAVVVATPSRFHGEVVRAALECDLHVFCEKPFCLDLEEAGKLVQLAKERNLINQVGYHHRFIGTFRETRKLLDAGIIGRVHHIRAETYGPVVLRPRNATWRSSRREGGGCLYDYASHAINLMDFLVGSPKGVSGSTLNSVFSDDVDDAVYTTFDYGNGMTGQLAANWSDASSRKMSTKISLWGDKGRITADRQEVQIFCNSEKPAYPKLTKGWNVRYITDMTKEVWYYLRGEEYSEQMEHFFYSIEARSVDELHSFASALRTDTVITMIQRDAAGKTSGAAPPVVSSGGFISRVLGRSP